MGKWLLLAFTAIPLVELMLLTWLGGVLGFWPTVAIVLVTGVIGASLAKREGLRVASEWQVEMAAGRVPADGLAGALLVLVGGIFLVTPGVLTDVVGLSLLVPPIRKRIAGWLRKRMQARVQDGSAQVHMSSVGFGGSVGLGGMGDPFAAARRRGPEVIEVEAEELEVSRPGLEA